VCRTKLTLSVFDHTLMKALLINRIELLAYHISGYIDFRHCSSSHRFTLKMSACYENKDNNNDLLCNFKATVGFQVYTCCPNIIRRYFHF